MSTCENAARRDCPPRRRRASATHARVAGPLAAAALVEVAAIALAVIVELPLGFTLLVLLGVAVLAAVLARRTVGSLVAGAGLRVAQPYEPGEQIRLFVPSLNSVEDAEIVRMGPANTTLMTASGLVLVPNARMLRGTTPSR